MLYHSKNIFKICTFKRFNWDNSIVGFFIKTAGCLCQFKRISVKITEGVGECKTLPMQIVEILKYHTFVDYKYIVIYTTKRHNLGHSNNNIMYLT